MKKRYYILTIALAALLAGGGTIIADNVWQGHENIVATKANIDKLTTMIADKKADLAKATTDLNHAKSDLDTANANLANTKAKLITDNGTQVTQDQYNNLKGNNADLDKKLAKKEAEIQQKIKDGQDNVDAKQKELDAKQAEVDKANKTINDLTAKLQSAKTDNDQLKAAIQDAQGIKDYSDKAVRKAGN